MVVQGLSTSGERQAWTLVLDLLRFSQCPTQRALSLVESPPEDSMMGQNESTRQVSDIVHSDEKNLKPKRSKLPTDPVY